MRGSNISNKFCFFPSYSAARARHSFLIFYYVYEIISQIMFASLMLAF